MSTNMAARRAELAPLRRAAVVAALALTIVALTACRVGTDSPEGAGAATAEPTSLEPPITKPTPGPSTTTEPPSTQPTGPDEQPTGTTVADVTMDTGFDLPDSYERPSVPADAVVAANVVNYATAAGIDDALASLEASLLPGQILVSGDFSGCILIAVWALPMPDGVSISYEMHPSVDCAVAIEYRAFFVIDRTGINSTGTWDYTDDPAITVLQVFGSTG